MRNSLKSVSWKSRREVVADLKDGFRVARTP
ncbi:hypothetical protein LOY48_07035 [Pseudomonas siliginis]|uniref:Uncharacterized protein n=1 Tax=Pseudomonas siliginis TaxID=2842346 RepID=A0ABY5CGP7_9PSED|nr:hypothetical protein [Pseudomonas siliginis]UST75839.1 hypothetical protein NF675_07035 [Pseudomonas siliginis]UST86448.1 hypothetical protein NF677_07135 [Pseudomonas siliginis]UVL95864.1 hypothetical protein LOY48_07035 [Pseudomonas siliginis]